MRRKKYIHFSHDLHAKRVLRPLSCQIELTYNCPLRCRHCYTRCYNNVSFRKLEKGARDVKIILDKCRDAGVLWICFSGGDPLTRDDFSEIYIYAKKKGFIITIFSSLVSLNKILLELFKEYPPFCIETTLNSSTLRGYKEITEKPYFKKHLSSIKKLRDNNLQVKIKTQITKQNIDQIGGIKRLVESIGLVFRPATGIHARLDGDPGPCRLRMEPETAIDVDEKYGSHNEECSVGALDSGKLLNCAAGSQAFWISPQGRMFICECIREPGYDLLQKGNTVEEGFDKINREVHSRLFSTDSRCRQCEYRVVCGWCPGKAFLEKGDYEAPVDYFCRYARELSRTGKRDRLDEM